MQNFQQNLQKLEAADTQVLGVSMDSTFSNGLYNPKYKAARRVNYLIDKDGKVVEMQIDNDAVDPTKIVTLCERRKTKE
jgi:peroxiredoxin